MNTTRTQQNKRYDKSVAFVISKVLILSSVFFLSMQVQSAFAFTTDPTSFTTYNSTPTIITLSTTIVFPNFEGNIIEEDKNIIDGTIIKEFDDLENEVISTGEKIVDISPNIEPILTE